MTIQKLSRKAIQQGLDQVPFVDLMGVHVDRQLTAKQKTFAREVAKGSTGAEAYRKAYGNKGQAKTQGNNAVKLKQHNGIQLEIEAYKMALEAQTYATPAALRALVIHSLVKVLTDDETPASVKVAAAKVAGSITEVGLYTERKEVRTITSSEDARAKVMTELKRLMLSDATDATMVDSQADSLLAELATHRVATPQTVENADSSYEHTIPLERIPSFSDPTLSTSDTPPVDDFFDTL
jgi:hypothetical protein